MSDRLSPGQTTGAEHFLEAERLLELVRMDSSPDTMLRVSELIAMAQVHATLAQASAAAAPAHRYPVGYGWDDMESGTYEPLPLARPH